MISEIRIAKPVSRIKFWNPRRLFVFGYPWYGPVFTVGTGMMYSTLYNSLAAQKESTVHLLFPSATQGTTMESGFPTSHKPYIKAVRPNTVLELSVGGVNNCFGCYQEAFFEDIQIRCTYANWSSAFITDINSNCFFNKCWINGSYHAYNYSVYSWSSAAPNLLFKNCYISRGYAHFSTLNLGSTRLRKTQLDNALTLSSTVGSLAEADYVITPTEGYGYGYGEWMIQGVEDYCQIS